MASPFKVFRKHQKAMLACLGVMVMVGFVILPVIMQGMGQRKYTDPLIATTTTYGDVQESNLRGLRWRRQVALRFFESLGVAVIMADGRPEYVQMAMNSMAPIEAVGITSDEAVVETWLLARRAEQLGLIVDDRAINDFLAELMQGRVSPDGLKGVLERIGISEDDLFAVLREELLAMRLKRMFRISLAGVTPAQRWDYFQRLYREVTIESFPVQVSEFVDEVPEPDEATLREFFNKHKDVAYDPSSPDPGFREPKKVDVEYLKAEYESFFDREREAVTQEELEKYYQDHKEEYRQEELPTLDEKPPSEKPEQEKLQEESAEPVTPAPEPEAPTTEEAPSDQQPSTDQGPMTGQDASMGQEASSPAAEKEPAEAGPAAKAPVEKPSPDQQKPAAAEPADKATPGSPDSPDDATSLLRVTSPFRLASFAEEVAEPTQPGGAEEAPAASEVPSNEAAPTEQPEAEPAPPQRPTAEASPTEEPSPEATSSPEPPAEPAQAQAAPAEQPPAGPSPEAESATQGPRSEPQATDSAPSEGPAIPGIAPQEPAYLPLEKVEDEIRRRLARDKANAKIEGLLSDLRNKVTRYHNLLIRFQVDSQTKKGDETVVPPTRPDFAAWAKEYDLIARRTGLISALEAEKLDIGESLVAGRASFVEHVLDLPKNRAEISRDDDGNYYLFWKLDEVEERVAEFDEEGVRERALRVWKMLEARKLAAEEAERVAAVARKAKKPLREVFADRPGIVVTESQFFSWLTYGAIEPWMAYGPPTISDVQGVDTPGHDFMRAVFSLTKGEVGTAMNHPQTAVYVVQVTDGKPLPEVLWSRFLSESYLNYLRASDHDRYLAEKAWLDGIKSDVGFRWDAEWQRQASQRRQEA